MLTEGTGKAPKGKKRSAPPPTASATGGEPVLSVQEKAITGAPSSSAPTRLFPRPIRLDVPLRRGATIALEHRLYSIEHLAFERRLTSVEWWSDAPVSRDYVRVWLRSPSGLVEAIAYREQGTGTRMLQAICD
jgi:hypothetical protein